MSEEYIDPNLIFELAKDEFLPEISKKTLKERYYYQNEDSPQKIFARVASYYAKNKAQAKRLYNYMSDLWFMPSTPILSNGGTVRGLPVSCYTNEVEDNFDSISEIFTENGYLSKEGGGIGTNWSNVRAIGENISERGSTSGIMPFIGVQEAYTTAVSQGSMRRGSTASYLNISHPEVLEFIDIRKNTGDSNRRFSNIHHGLIITDDFMQAVSVDAKWEFIRPSDGRVSDTPSISARLLWQKILHTRLETGEPYLIFIDTVNKEIPLYYKLLNKKVTTSNLCAEITLNTKNTVGTCFLSSLNLARYGEWENNQDFLPDVFEFIDAVVDDFIKKTGSFTSKQESAFARARESAIAERSVGIGVMGFHTLLQKRCIPIESYEARHLNLEIFNKLRSEADKISENLAKERGPCGDYKACKKKEKDRATKCFLYSIHSHLFNLISNKEVFDNLVKMGYDGDYIESIHDFISRRLDLDEDHVDFTMDYLFSSLPKGYVQRTKPPIVALKDSGVVRYNLSTEKPKDTNVLVFKPNDLYYLFYDYEDTKIIKERFSHKLAIAPTASISLICGGVSPGIDPIVANEWVQKGKMGAELMKNEELVKLLKTKGKNTEEVWQNIRANGGSVSQLDFLSDHEKRVFKTAFEIDQEYLVLLASDRASLVCQSQSLNLFFPPTVSKQKLHDVHYLAYEKNVKSLYYVRSQSLVQGENINLFNCNEDSCEVCQ